ncbi:helix-turn-helix transcriptional regulator [Ideonella sp. A 288]|uniref:helix-turn-helix transcriptional regulator n=1 Tax=Ideonella sp. A 288 TaxID=1962181 RepID=UPI000B4C0609|nr:LuxR C-terminal-related transcriptional regulator [Ideonella sp. A 288]
MASKDGHGGDAPAVRSLVWAIHSASVSDTAWPDVLERVRLHLDACVVTLGHHQFTTGADSALFESPGDLRFSQDIAAYSARNPWFLSSEDYVPGRVMTGDELISHVDLRRTDFYRGFLQPRGLLHRLCGVVAKRAAGVHFVSAYRTEAQGAFGGRERAELEVLLDHITLSLQSHWRWQEADDLSRALLSLSDHDSNPLILVTAQGEPVYRNAAAEHLLDRRVGLRLEGGRLVAASGADQRMLAETIARVARGDPAQSGAAPAVVTLAGSPPVVAVVRAAGQVFNREVGERLGLVMVAVRGTHAAHDPAQCVFARQYELTAAQSKVSALVFAGQPLAAIAASLNVSENTVRSHLKQIFQKTDTHGQMDLVHLHARVCPTLP